MPPWTTTSRQSSASTGVLFLEMFGRLTSEPHSLDSTPEEKGLSGIFAGRADLMRWSVSSKRASLSGLTPSSAPALWRMEEAELTPDSGDSRIGFVQLVLEAGIDAAIALTPMTQCFADSLQRIGVMEMTGFQVTARYLEPSQGTRIHELIGVGQWFYKTRERRAGALMVFDNELLGEGDEKQIVAKLQRFNSEWLQFGPLVQVPQEYSIETPVEAPPNFQPSPFPRTNIAVSLTLPEWTPSAVAWVLAFVVDQARSEGQGGSNFTLRLARV